MSQTFVVYGMLGEALVQNLGIDEMKAGDEICIRGNEFLNCYDGHAILLSISVWDYRVYLSSNAIFCVKTCSSSCSHVFDIPQRLTKHALS